MGIVQIQRVLEAQQGLRQEMQERVWVTGGALPRGATRRGANDLRVRKWFCWRRRGEGERQRAIPVRVVIQQMDAVAKTMMKPAVVMNTWTVMT